MNNKILAIIIVFLGIIAILSSSKKETTFLIPKEQEEDIKVRIKDTSTKNISTIDLETYIIGVVAGEMPASFEVEALKAQAIASRTYAVYKMQTSSNDYDLVTDISNQVYITEEEMQAKWKTQYQKYKDKITEAVNDTKNLIMTYNDEVISSFYFAISNGKTENVSSVFGENKEYLKSVDSMDTNVNNFKVETTISKRDFCSKLGIDCQTIVINNIKKNSTNRVEEITINNKTFKGTEIRKLLNLRSTDFTFSIADSIKITTYGYGHGVGMSQYGANEMAKNGSTYEEILKHYYQNINIVKNNV